MTDIGGATKEWYARVGGSDLIIDAYRASTIQMAGMAVAIYVVQMLLRMRGEEAGGRLEPVLAAGVSRPRWLIANLLNAGLGARVLLARLRREHGRDRRVGARRHRPNSALLGAALVQLPGILVIAAVVVVVTALLPRAAATISWTVVLVSLLLGPLFGAATMQLPSWTQELSPFTHIPKLPAADLAALPVLGLIAIAAALAAAGLAAFRHRDLALPT